MDQKNTIVKCNRSPKCLFEHNGVCDNYVINIGVDGKCKEYTETAIEDRVFCYECDYFADTGLLQCSCDKHEQYVYRKAPACGDFKAKRGQRAKSNFIEDGWIDPEIVKEVCQPFTMKIAEFNKPNKNKRIIKIPSMSKEDREIMNDIGYVPPTYSHYDDGEEE